MMTWLSWYGKVVSPREKDVKWWEWPDTDNDGFPREISHTKYTARQARQ